MHELATPGPAGRAQIHPNDSQRIQRALEVCELTGTTLSSLQAHSPAALQGTARIWALVPEARVLLHERLASRFNQMMSQGFLDEVRALHGRGDLRAEHASMRAVGYRQLWAHCDGHSSLSEAVERGVAATRQLAKRQLTWLRSDRSIRIMDPQAPDAFAGVELGGGRGTGGFNR